MTNANANAKMRISALDGLRAVAILLVVVSHVRRLTLHPSHGVSVIALYVGNGNLGVEAFFVLSGFLITTLLLKEFDKRGSIDVGQFYVRRIRRILPAFYVWIAALCALAAFGVIRVTASDFLGTALFVGDYFPGSLSQSWWTGNSWTLSIEEWFYIFFPALVMTLGYRKVIVPLVAIIVIEPVLRIYEYVHQISPIAITYQTHTRFDTIAYGCLLAIFLRERPVRAWFASRWADGAAVVAFAIVAIVIPTLDAKLTSVFKFLIGFPVDGVGVSIVIAYLVERPLCVPARALSYRPVVWLGTISYSLYLWQQPFLATTNPLPLSLRLAGALACAVLSYYIVERPILARGRRPEKVVSGALPAQ